MPTPHDCYSYRAHRFPSFTSCRWLRGQLVAVLVARLWPGCRRAGGLGAAAVGALGVDQVGQPPHLALHRLHAVALQLGGVAVDCLLGMPLVRAGPAFLERVRRPSSTRSRTSVSVRPKNANLMSKLSSSQAVGPTSDICA